MDQVNWYEEAVKKELVTWEKQMTESPSVAKILTKNLQRKVHKITPQKVQNLITAAVKTMTETVLTGSRLLTKAGIVQNCSLEERDAMAEKAYRAYHKVAVAQGIGFGLSGVLVNLADLPALLAIQVKFLFDCAKFYGYDPDDPAERVFMLYVFQLAYSNGWRRRELFPLVKEWDTVKAQVSADWEKLQMEYRDYMDIAKLLQLLPVIGAPAGAAANHGLMKTLKQTAMNAYRLRALSDGSGAQTGELP